MAQNSWYYSQNQGSVIDEIVEKESVPSEHLLKKDDIENILRMIFFRISFSNIDLSPLTHKAPYTMEDSKKERLWLLSKNLAEKYFGKNSEEYVNSLIYLIDFYKKTNPKKADGYAQEAEKIINAKYLKINTSFYLSLGEYYLEKNDYEKAESLYLKSYDLYKKDSTDTFNPAGYLIDLYKRMGKWEKAFEYQREYDELKTNEYSDYDVSVIDVTYPSLDFSLFPGFWSGENILQIVNCYPSQEAINHAFDVVLSFKGAQLIEIKNIRNAIYQSKNQNLRNAYKELHNVQSKIDTIRAKMNLAKSEKCAILVESENARDSLKKFVESSLTNEFIKNNKITWKDIQTNLFDKEAAIEFVNFSQTDYQNRDTLATYAAFLLRKDSEAPIYIPLFEKSQLDSLLLKNDTKDSIRIKNLFTDNGQKLYRLIWQALEKYLQGIETVYYSPSGILNRIAFSAIPVDSVLLMDKYNLQMLSSTREIVRLKKGKKTFLPLHNAVEYGGIIYDADDKKLLKSAVQVLPAQTNLFISDTTTRSSWGPLSGTATEVTDIEDLLKQSNISNFLYTGLQATEESFKQLSGNSPELIHIATHGFFLEDKKEISQNGFMKLMNTDSSLYINPLLRSGLLFAGANRAWTNDDILPGIEDGILTAEEISHLDLSKTKLVVLSACDTGLGEVQNSEGVFGLQRAFKLAGAETLVMSLWKVDDKTTSQFMLAFYRNLLAGKGKLESFRIAQKQIREQQKNPYYWAAFVMMD